MSALISAERLYHVIGLILALAAGLILRDRSNPRRFSTAMFWGLFAACMLFGDSLTELWGVALGHRIVGATVVLLALIAGVGGVGRGAPSPRDTDTLRRSAERLGNRLFVPALSISVVTIACSLTLKGATIGGIPILDKQVTIASLGVAAAVCLALTFWITRARPLQSLEESKGMLDAMGWAATLPMLLAMLGGVFVATKTGDSVKLLTIMLAPEHQRLLVVALYCIGMATFTAVMGNAFAAFPVMTAGIAVPLLVKEFGGNPAPVAAIGMCAGYCGTLVTPMAANFNTVPAAILGLKDRYGVIRAQFPTALAMLGVSILIMYFFAFS
jgi:uncharacterized membrane protein